MVLATVSGAGTGQLVGIDAANAPTQTTNSVRAIFGRSGASPWTLYDPTVIHIAVFR